MTLHANATQLLAAWEPPDRDQTALRDAYLRHLRDHHDAMWRSCSPDHLTASSIIVDPATLRVLLTLHRRVGRWLQTGGHCESGDASLAGAALRESSEESGIDGLRIGAQPVLLSRHEVPCGSQRPAHHLDVQFLVLAPTGAEPHCSDESDDVAWFAVDRLPSGADESVRALVRRALQRLDG